MRREQGVSEWPDGSPLHAARMAKTLFHGNYIGERTRLSHDPWHGTGRCQQAQDANDDGFAQIVHMYPPNTAATLPHFVSGYK